MKIQNIDSEISKHLKKKNSSTSKSKEKSKHKHIYKDCLVITEKHRAHKAKYCTICGKLDNHSFSFETVPCGNGYVRMLTSDEMLEKYKHLEKIHIKDYFQKYIPVESEDNQ